MRTLTRSTAAESICDYPHDPILEPSDDADYALSFVSALLFHADARACFSLLRGLMDVCNFPDPDPQTEYWVEETPAVPSTPLEDDEAKRSLDELLRECCQKAAELRVEDAKNVLRLANSVNWVALLYFVQPEKVLERLDRRGVRLQLTESNGFRAAAAVDGIAFDIGGRTKAEAMVKLIILLQLRLIEPLVP
jgi:hypothetical protein